MFEKYITYRADRMIAEIEENKEKMECMKEQYAELCEQDIKGVSYDKDRVQTSLTNDGNINMLIRKMELERKIRLDEHDIKIFDAAWDKLTEKERYVLSEFYKAGYVSRQDAIDSVCEMYNIERTQVYNLKDEAIKQLVKYLAI